MFIALPAVVASRSCYLLPGPHHLSSSDSDLSTSDDDTNEEDEEEEVKRLAKSTGAHETLVRQSKLKIN